MAIYKSLLNVLTSEQQAKQNTTNQETNVEANKTNSGDALLSISYASILILLVFVVGVLLLLYFFYSIISKRIQSFLF
jgi:hypothetical protein